MIENSNYYYIDDLAQSKMIQNYLYWGVYKTDSPEEIRAALEGLRK
ncbi:hypothetical protein ACHRV1_07940 [Flavobacterium aquidurense]